MTTAMTMMATVTVTVATIRLVIENSGREHAGQCQDDV